VHLTNGHGDGLLNEAFIMNLKKIFPHLEKLVINPVIDSWDRDEGRHVVLPECLDLWSMENLVAVLETVGSVKNISISNMTTMLSCGKEMILDAKMTIFQAALEIVKKKFPIEAELLLIDEDSGYALKKTKWVEAVIKTKVTSEEIEASMGKNK